MNCFKTSDEENMQGTYKRFTSKRKKAEKDRSDSKDLIPNEMEPPKEPLNTLFKSENERQKIEPVPNLLPRASRNFPDVKTRNENYFHNWTSEIIPFICFGMQMDGT